MIFSLFLAAVVAVNLWRFAARYVSGKKVDSAEGETGRERHRESVSRKRARAEENKSCQLLQLRQHVREREKRRERDRRVI